MNYKGRKIPDSACVMGIKRNRQGKYVPLCKTADNLILTGHARNTRQEAQADLDFVIELLGPVRVYT